MSNLGQPLVVTGATGFVGRNFLELLRARGHDFVALGHGDYDLLEQERVRALFREKRPHTVFHFAGYVGGILANRDFPAEFCYRNLMMGAMVLHEAWQAGVKKFVTVMGGCSYPGKAPSPIAETALWTGYPQPESAPYSLAKAMSSELAKSYRRQYGFDAIVLVPGNLYGPWDNFDLSASHVIPALIRKYIEAGERGADEIVAWGTGAPRRDFVYVADVCAAILVAAEKYSGPDIINLSSGRRVTIKELVSLIAELTAFKGRVVWDATKPDGQMDKGFDVTRMHEWLGVDCPTTLRDGLIKTIAWFRENRALATRPH
jgi:GDP-L-fucose synthase